MKPIRYLPLMLLFIVVLLAACGGAVPPANQATPAAATTSSPEAAGTPAASPEASNAHALGTPGAPAKQWPAPPAMTIDPAKIYVATIKTDKGDITVQLMADKAPNAVNNFVFLAKEGFYDNTTFHRVLDGFMAQGGDPTGTGTGGPGYTFADEINPELSFDKRGVLAMANSGPDTNGSQFFITFGPADWLNGNYTIFGQVVDGDAVLDQLTRRDPEQNPTFMGDAIRTIEISEAGNSKLPTPTTTPTPFAPDVSADDHFMATMPAEKRVNYWNEAPENALEKGKIYVATFHTDAGDIVVELASDLAPENVNNFVALARAGYYDGTHFYQVIDKVVAIGGDPLDNGNGSPGYFIPDELAKGVFNDKGWLGSPEQAPDSNPGQFFFTLSAAPWLAERFSPLGRIVKGADVLDKLEIRDPANPGEGDSKGTLVQRIDISTTDTSQLPAPTPTPTPFSPTLPPQGKRPLADVEPAKRDGYFNSAPAMQIDPTKDYSAVIHTDVGDLTIDLKEKDAPNAVNNFVVLAESGFYDNTTFHRVIKDFMAQAGDPSGTGAGGPGYTFEDEFVPTLRHDKAGVVSMANRGPNTNGSQFFITFAPTPWLDDQHTIFGQLTAGEDVLKQIKLRDPEKDTDPGTKITSIEIIAK